MKIELYSVLLLFLIGSGCKQKIKYSELTIADRFSEQGSATVDGKTRVSYDHNLILTNFDIDQDASNDLIYLTDKYLDTLSTDKPVASITICKPYKLERTFDSRDIGPVRDHAIITLYFNDDKVDKGLYEIDGVTLWEDGKPISVSPFNLDERLLYQNNRKDH